MSTSPATIRRATRLDATGLAACVRAAYEPWIVVIGAKPGPMLENYDDVVATKLVHVAEVGNLIVGGVVLAETDEGFLLDNIAVHPRFAGRGIGSRLLALAEREAMAHGHDSIYLYTHERMAANIALYANAGYVEFARRTVGPYARMFMRKQLNPKTPRPDSP